MTISNAFLKTGFMTFAFSLSAFLGQAQVVNLTISNIKSAEGQILVGVFKDQQSFKDEKPAFRHRFPKTSLSNGVLKVHLDLPPGSYGFALVDDENKNGKLDKNMIGIPKEGIGFSNFYLSGMSKPSFNDFKFEVKSPSVTVQCKIRNF
ncbi:DUF2141 domain-containing protein [Tellurirhabdus bombi]|uniref:DUF2141 domain-containing protein n=1 Tax=Tellurirhabdus bombi TaxID=2907205 RepID=UPI001F2BCB0C|nr:DUF2141 domain-containing protein [Tellurirhabdus bombi]